MSENQDENKVMSQTVDWQSEIATIAGPFEPHDSRESWLRRAAMKSSATFWHVKALYYGQLTDPKYSVAQKIMNTASKERIAGARHDAAKLTNIYQAAAKALENIDEDFHRDQITALVSAARILGDLDRA